MDLNIFRDPLSINAVTQFVITSTSPTTAPTTFDFTLEGNCISRPNVVQRIELFNYVTNAFEIVDERNANRAPNPDLTVVVSPSGDLSRFVDPSTREIQARVRYRADIARAGFASNTDQANLDDRFLTGRICKNKGGVKHPAFFVLVVVAWNVAAGQHARK